jgi:hypothetical protein
MPILTVPSFGPCSGGAPIRRQLRLFFPTVCQRLRLRSPGVRLELHADHLGFSVQLQHLRHERKRLDNLLERAAGPQELG